MEDFNFGLSEYIKQGEISKVEKTKIWEMAIGLQDVDNLKPSKYLLDTAKDHIEGNITIKEVQNRINSYYKEIENIHSDDDIEQADKVSARIVEILSDNSFNFNPTELLNIHKKLFDGIIKENGLIRTYNFTKKEWVLNGDTVTYSSYENIMDALKYYFEQEKKFSYKNLSIDESIKHLSIFTSNIWQIHPFCEGNTRTTAVFIIKYLKTFGFDLNNDVYKEHSWYFRNALVRANYKKFDLNVFENTSYLEKFFYNLLTKTNYELKNRYIHIDYKEEKGSLKQFNYALEEQIILNMIKENPNITQNEIAITTNKSVRTIKTIMNDMQKKNIIIRKNGKRNAYWEIIE